MSESNQIKRVVGIKYEAESGLPKVILKGSGKQAEAILEYQKSIKGPMLVNDDEMLNQLYKIPMDGDIGPELFELVAAVLVHVYAVQEATRGKSNA